MSVSVFRNCLHFRYVASQLDVLRKLRRPGRPSYQETWEDRLYRAIHHGTIPGDMTSGVLPMWWRPSMPLNVSEAEAERIAGKLVDAVQHAPKKEELGGEAGAVGDAESPSKRVKIHHCAEVKDWCLDLVAI